MFVSRVGAVDFGGLLVLPYSLICMVGTESV